MTLRLSKISLILTIIAIQFNTEAEAQQDPQYSQYMYNTMVVNPAYVGQRETLSVTGLFRTQWVGLDGAPQTLTFGAHSPLKNDRIGLGISAIRDRIGPADETYLNANFSYTIFLDDKYTKFSFGFSGGIHQLQTDWSRGTFQNPDVVFSQNLSLVSPTVGAGLYLHSKKWYLGASVPNFLTTDHYDDFAESVAQEQMHFFIIGGYVFDLSKKVKFKPAFLTRAVSGTPLIVDVSANFLINDKFTIGAAWRWDDSLSALAGFQINNTMYIGYAYDLTTTGLNNYNGGSHELMLRFELPKPGKYVSPRFF